MEFYIYCILITEKRLENFCKWIYLPLGHLIFQKAEKAWNQDTSVD